MEAHTPAPWRAAGGNVFADTNRYYERPIAQIGVPLDKSDNRVEELEANARLIAAAPELLAALRGVVRVADRATAEFDAARAAIAKAGQ